MAVFLLVLGPAALAADPSGQETPSAPSGPRTVRVDTASAGIGFALQHPANWSPVDDDDPTSLLLLNVEAALLDSPVAASANRLLVSTERRLTAEDAQLRLRQIAAESPDVPVEYAQVGGWPALVRAFSDVMPKIGQEDRAAGIEPRLRRTTVAIAAGTVLIRVEGTIVVDQQVAHQEALAIGRSVTFDVSGDPAAAERALETLRSLPVPAPSYVAPPPGLLGASGDSADAPAAFGGDESSAGAVQNVGNFSEIETIASTSGRHVIVATNSRAYSVSNDGGRTFTAGNVTPVYPANGDPSLGFGQSETFYFGFIAFPDGTGGPGNGVQQCTTGIAASTDDGQTFAHRGHATTCPFSGAGVCFPDQEHITADRFNPSATAQDQVYSAWRNFTPGGGNPNCNAIGSGSVQAQLRCSTDSGANWGNTRNLAGDFPRVTVGPDGFVYVVTRVGGGGQMNLYKYSSCDSGLTLQPGFPSVVTAGTSAVTCPVAGLDRCNDGNDLRSATVAVDDLDASHVFVTYATNTAATNEDVVVQDSTDGGATFGAAVRLNSGFAARRYMPWVCAVGGTAYVGWFDRRAASPVDNSLTHFYIGNASRGPGGFFAGTESRVSPFADSNCQSGWSCSPRSTNDSESCTIQPQLAGSCNDGVANTPDSGQRCDFSDGGCPNPGPSGNPESCSTGGGCPKYGDYNGIACAAGRVYAAYASATTAVGVQTTDIDSYVQTKVVCCVPEIAVTSELDFGGICQGESSSRTLDICNTGEEDLEVTGITSSDSEFAVTPPVGGFPVTIGPDSCFPVEVVFSPTSEGPKSAQLTIASNDPVWPTRAVLAFGTGEAGDINASGTTNLGDVCATETGSATITVCNTGSCPLTVSSATLSATGQPAVACADFAFTSNPFPSPIQPAGCLPLNITFTPTSAGPKTCDVNISSNDPDEATTVIAVSANTPLSEIAISGALGFAPEVVQSVGQCTTAQPYTIVNTGVCPATVASVGTTGQYLLSGLPPLPLSLLPGEQVGDGALSVLFAPVDIDRDVLGSTQVTWVLDPIAGNTQMDSSSLCGEGVRTGARVLVSASGVPLASVDSIRLQRVAGNRNRPQLDTVDTARDVTLQTVLPAAPCAGFQYHREYGTVSNPIQLLPGSYVVTVQTKVNGKVTKKSVGFDVNTCDFVPTILVDF